jgi:CBS domain-containing protein
VCIDKDQTLSEAMSLMEKKRVSRLLVKDEGAIVGILTEEDLARRLGAANERKLTAAHIHVSSAMTRNLMVIQLKADFREAAKIMLKFGFSSLPVVAGEEIVGLLTKTDLLRKLTSSEKKVSSFYTKKPVIANPADTLVHARKLMMENKIHRLLVTDNGALVGVLTERDVARGLAVFRKALDKGHHPPIGGMKVEHVMTKDPLTITSETTVGDAAKTMLENEVSGLPVLAKEFGILTKTDLVRGIADNKLP